MLRQAGLLQIVLARTTQALPHIKCRCSAACVVRICVCACPQMHTHTHTHPHRRFARHIQAHTLAHANTHSHCPLPVHPNCTHICIHTHTHTHTHIYTHIHTYTHTFTFTSTQALPLARLLPPMLALLQLVCTLFERVASVLSALWTHATVARQQQVCV